MVSNIQAPFLKDNFQSGFINPLNGKELTMPLDTVIGQTKVGLYRGNFSHENMPGVVEGTSHDFLADVYRKRAKADIGVIRGFRYGSQIPPGPITLGDIYHYMPIGPYIARGKVKGQTIKNLIENPADGSLNTDTSKWGGGWLFGWSGLKFDLDPYLTKGNRATNIQVWNDDDEEWEALDLTKEYWLAGYNYDSEPCKINKAPTVTTTDLDKYPHGCVVEQVMGKDDTARDGVMVVVDYLKKLNKKGKKVNPKQNRITILKPLPDYNTIVGFPVIQMFYGARIADMP